MLRIIKSIAGALALGLCLTTGAHAIPVTLNFTADNITSTGGLCDNAACQTGIGWGSLGSVPNLGDWTAADSVTVDLGAGTHYFVWYVDNVGTGSSTNPAGLLAEILWGSQAKYSSTSWEVTTDVGDPSSWVAASEYGLNGGANIWTANLGSAVGGISTSARWLWTDSNFSSSMDQFAAIRTSITVPEPGTLVLLGIGLIGFGATRRKRRAA